MNLSEYISAVRRKLALAADDSAALPDADVVSAINAGLKAIAAEKEWHWLFTIDTGTTTADSNLIPVPPDFTRTVYLSIGGRSALEERSVRDLVGSGTEKGYPNFYAYQGGNFLLYPTPRSSEGYQHAYYRAEPELVLATDAPLLPDAYSPWLVAEAAKRLPFRTNSPEKQAELLEEIAGWRARASDNAKRSAMPPSIRRTRPSIWQPV